MNGLMGFVVLSLPILAALLIMVLATLAARVVTRRTEGPKRKKAIAGFIAALIVILIPTWDEIAGRLYFHYLCATEGGAKVHKQVKLPAEYWNADGTPIFLDVRGNRVRSKLDEDYDVFKRTGEQQVSQLFRIKRYGYTVSDRHTNVLLGTLAFYFYFGGWLQNATSTNVMGIHCPDEQDVEARFLRAIFVPEQDQVMRR